MRCQPLLTKLENQGKRVVIGKGPLDAKVVFLGEALGVEEERKGEPFVGPSGWLLDKMLHRLNIQRSEIYIMNVIPIRPRDNKLTNLKELGVKIEDFYPFVAEMLEMIKPKVVLTLGEPAMQCLTGRTGVTKWRGSILESSLVTGLKVIPTLHPAFVNRLGDQSATEAVEKMGAGGMKIDYAMGTVSLYLDIKRAWEEQNIEGLQLPNRNIIIRPNISTVLGELERMVESPEVSFDIETRSNGIICIALSDDPNFAISIPTTPEYWGAEHLNLVKTALSEFFWNHRGLEAQNGSFDMTFMLTEFPVRILHFDTMIAHYRLYPELPHGLDFLASVYTREPYYKFEGKGSAGDELWTYNAKDAAVTRETASVLKTELREVKMEDVFYGYVMPLFHTLLRLSWRGVAVDKKAIEELDKTLEGRIQEFQKKLNSYLGFELNTRSPKQMKEFLYEKEKLPTQYKGRGPFKTVSTDDDSIAKLIQLRPNLEYLQVIRDIRENRNAQSKFTRVIIDYDGRIRSSYGCSNTDTGRLSSRKNYLGTGFNLQNVKREKEYRRCFTASLPTRRIVKHDIPQGENRIVAYLSKDANLKQFLREGGDVHKWNAALFLDKPIEEVTKKERGGAKPIVHALNYGLGPFHLKDLILKNFGINMSIAEVQEKREKYFKKCQAVRQWQAEIEQELTKNKVLITPLGFRRPFMGRMSKDMYKKAYAFKPQSICGEFVNMAMVRTEIRLPETAELVLQVHDEVDTDVEEKDVPTVLQIYREEFCQPIPIEGDVLVFPPENAVGANWGELEEIKI